MYVSPNFKTKKALKEAVARGVYVSVYNAGLYDEAVTHGEVSVEGPHSPKPHMWYARVRVRDGQVVKVL